MIPEQIRALAAQGLAPEEVAEALTCEVAYVKSVLGVGLTAADEAAAMDLLRGTLTDPFAKTETRVSVAKWIMDTRYKAIRSKAATPGQTGTPMKDGAELLAAAVQRFQEAANRTQQKHEINIGIRITQAAGTEGADREVLSTSH